MIRVEENSIERDWRVYNLEGYAEQGGTESYPGYDAEHSHEFTAVIASALGSDNALRSVRTYGGFTLYSDYVAEIVLHLRKRSPQPALANFVYTVGIRVVTFNKEGNWRSKLEVSYFRGWEDANTVLQWFPSFLDGVDDVNNVSGVYGYHTFEVNDMFNYLQTELQEQFASAVPGEWYISEERYEHDANGNRVLVGSTPNVATVQYNFVLPTNVSLTRRRFDPRSNQNTTQFSCDLATLPSAWSLGAGAQQHMRVTTHRNLITPEQVVHDYGLTDLALQHLTFPWNGRDDQNRPLKGHFEFDLRLLATKANTQGNFYWRVRTDVVCSHPTCGCPTNDEGLPQLTVVIDGPQEPDGRDLSTPLMLAGPNYPDPNSLGWGWRGPDTVRVFEQPGLVYYRNESNQFVSWSLDGSGAYVPTEPDNYLLLSKNAASQSALYEITFPDQSRRLFDVQGTLTADVDKLGNTVGYVYDSEGHLIQRTTGSRSVYYTYQADGQPVTIRDNNPDTGRLTQLHYYPPDDLVSPGRLRQIINPAGESQEFVYDAAGQILQIKDARGQVALTYTYDLAGRVVGELHYDQLRRTHNYGFLNVFVDSASAVETIDYDLMTTDENGAFIARRSVRYYDFLGNLIVFEEGFPQYALD